MEDPDKHLLLALKQFFMHLGVHSWEEMVAIFSAHDVEEEIKESKAPGPVPLKLVLLHKKLGSLSLPNME
jgi:hypothetical protein